MAGPGRDPGRRAAPETVARQTDFAADYADCTDQISEIRVIPESIRGQVSAKWRSASWTPAPYSLDATYPPADLTASFTSGIALAGQAGNCAKRPSNIEMSLW